MVSGSTTLIIGLLLEAKEVGWEPRFGIKLLSGADFVNTLAVGQPVLPLLVTIFGDGGSENYSTEIIIEKKEGLTYSEILRIPVLTVDECEILGIGYWQEHKPMVIIPKSKISFLKAGKYKLRWGSYKWYIDDAEAYLTVVPKTMPKAMPWIPLLLLDD